MEKLSYAQVLDIASKSSFIVVDEKLCEFYPDLFSSLKQSNLFKVKEAESSKNITVYKEIVDFFIECGITRSDEILVIGGGAISDLGGFVAATILRGVSWNVISTTLLGQIDAAIGGKVGINSEYGKNLIGSFHHPKNIYICEEFLKSLSKEDYQSGVGELLKYAFLKKEIYALIKEQGLTSEVIYQCGKEKERIVKEDFTEKGLRKTLNFGHTLGHAIEKVLFLPHGIAVFCGIEMILKLYKKDLLVEFNELSAPLELEVSLPKMDFTSFEKFLRKDKKSLSKETMEIIIPTKMGEVEIVEVETNTLIEKVKEELCEYFI